MTGFIFRDTAAVWRMAQIIVLGSCAGLIVLGFWVWGMAADRQSEIATLEARIALAAQVDTQATALGDGISFYESETSQLAQSEMQSDMQDLAEENQVSLEVIRADQIERVGANVRMTLTLNGVVNETQLGGYLRALADHNPMIVVDAISLRRARSVGRGNDQRPLAIQLKLIGFAKQ
ncbi:GspMb/PilO family protein [Loktanella agnita]|uniref:GspMb/PilO family protein n=1 Tax=Loktanella agnita TaxID=287097 RepID=UPI0039872831